MIKKILNRLKTIKNTENSNIPPVTHANINILDNKIELDVNGVPSSILFQYTGAVWFSSEMSPLIKVRLSKSTMLITNFFKQQIPTVAFSYSGGLKVISCTIMNFDYTSILPTINNKQQERVLNESKTNLEDDDLILHYEKRSKSSQKALRGHNAPTFNMSRVDEFGKIKKYGTREVEGIATAVIKNIPSLRYDAEKVTTRVETFTDKPMVSKPAVLKPVVLKPVVSKPTPSISTPKIKIEERKKY